MQTGRGPAACFPWAWPHRRRRTDRTARNSALFTRKASPASGSKRPGNGPEWWRDQGIDVYEQKNQAYKELTLHPKLREKGLDTAKNHIFFITCYDLDRFRRLVMESSFLKRFDIAPELAEAIKTDDEALLDFGFDWLRFSLFGENTVKVKDEELARKKKEILKQIKQQSKSKSKRAAHEKNSKLGLSG
jgi:hypothetical protein